MSRSSSILRDPAEKPFVSQGNSKEKIKSQNRPITPRKISQMLKKRPSSPKKTLAELGGNLNDRSDIRPSPDLYHTTSPTRFANLGVAYVDAENPEESLYANSESNDTYERIREKRSAGPKKRPSKQKSSRYTLETDQFDHSDSDLTGNLRNATSLPDFHQNNLVGPTAKDANAVTDIDDLVLSASMDNILSPAPDIPPVVKQALVDELKTVFGANGRRERVEKASEVHKKRPPLKNSMRGLRYYDPKYEEIMAKQAEADLFGEFPAKHPVEWTSEEVCDWLNNEGFHALTPLFQRRQIDGKDLSTLGKHDLIHLGVKDPATVDSLIYSIDELFKKAPKINPVTRSYSNSKNRLYASKADEKDGVTSSFSRNNPRSKNTNTKILKSKIPSFTRPGSGLLRKVSNLSEKQRRNQMRRSGIEDENTLQTSSSVAERAQMFNKGHFVPAPRSNRSRKNSVELQPGVNRVQSMKHDLEVQESHRKLEDIFNRKRKQEKLGSFAKTDCQSNAEMSGKAGEELAPSLNMKEITVHCEAIIEGNTSGGKPEYDWISYELPETSTSHDLLQAHLKGQGFNATEENLIVLETRECIGEKNNQSQFFKRPVHVTEKLFTTENSWKLRQRHYFEIIRKSHLAEALSGGVALESCGRCPGIERAMEALYLESNDALDVYAEVLVVLQRVKQAHKVAMISNPVDLEAVLKDQLHHVISNSEGLKKKRASANVASSDSHRKGKPGGKGGRTEEMDKLMKLGPSLLITTLNTAIKIYDMEEKFLMTELNQISKKQEEASSGPSLAEISSSLYSALSISGYATVVSSEMRPNRHTDEKQGPYNFKLASLRHGGVVVASLEADSILQEGDRIIEVNGQGVVTSTTEYVNMILEKSSSARIVAMRTEARDKVISSTMEAADLREDMRLVVNELRRESTKSKKLNNQKAQLIEVVNEMKKEKEALVQKLNEVEEKLNENAEKQEDLQNVLDALTGAHRETCDHLAKTTQDKIELADELQAKEGEIEKLEHKLRRMEDSLSAMEEEYETLLENESPDNRREKTGNHLKMDLNTLEQLQSVDKESLVEALQMNIEENVNLRTQYSDLLSLVEKHAPHILNPGFEGETHPSNHVDTPNIRRTLENLDTFRPRIESKENENTSQINTRVSPEFQRLTLALNHNPGHVSKSVSPALSRENPSMTMRSNVRRGNFDEDFGFQTESDQEI